MSIWVCPSYSSASQFHTGCFFVFFPNRHNGHISHYFIFTFTVQQTMVKVKILANLPSSAIVCACCAHSYLVCPPACTGVIRTWEKLPAILVMDLYYKCHAKLLLASSSALADSWHHQSQHPMMVISPLSDQTVKLECHRGRRPER